MLLLRPYRAIVVPWGYPLVGSLSRCYSYRLQATTPFVRIEANGVPAPAFEEHSL